MMLRFLHVDMDAFYASIEQHDHPELRGKPVVVGSPPDQRGVVSAASYEARQYGVRSAMPSREAGQRCPHAVFRPVNMKRYQDVSRHVFSILERYSPLIEPISIDEAFMNVEGAQRIFGNAIEIARRIRTDIHKGTGLTASVGVAPNKFLAKLASPMNKPDGLTIVPEDEREIRRFLAPLPVGRLWGVGKVTQATLENAGIMTVGDLQLAHPRLLAELLGNHAAHHIQRLSRGEDARQIEMDREEKSISREYTFLEDCSDRSRVEQVMSTLVDDVGGSLRSREKYASIVQIKIRWKDFLTITRRSQLSSPTQDDFQLWAAARALMNTIAFTQPVRLVGFGVSGLRKHMTAQLSLFDPPKEKLKKEELSSTVDNIRQRFGPDSIYRASSSDDG